MAHWGRPEIFTTSGEIYYAAPEKILALKVECKGGDAGTATRPGAPGYVVITPLFSDDLGDHI